MNNNHELYHTYSNNITHKRILIIGPTPPPLGGVSVHIKRVIAKLTAQDNVVHQINPEQLYRFNFLRKTPLKYAAQAWYLVSLCVKIIYYRPDVVMYHNFCARNSVPELMIITMFKKILSFTIKLKSLITSFVLSLSKHKRGLSFDSSICCKQLLRSEPDLSKNHGATKPWRSRLRTNGLCMFFIEHDCRHMYQHASRWKQWFNFYLIQCDQLVCIGDVTHKSYGDNGITMPSKMTVESAFLPPILSEEKIICATYPSALFTFLATHKPIVVVNAFQLTLWHGRDLYGIDQAIEMMQRLKKAHATIGLIIVLGSVGDASYYQLLMARIQEYALQDAIFIMSGQKELWPLLKYATVFIRPTLSDSFGISIAEALYVGTPAVASDVCKRPVDTILYKAGDVVDLSEKVSGVVSVNAKLKGPFVLSVFAKQKCIEG
jgi:glycosyltransferase involved in cell wall biosynthesis